VIPPAREDCRRAAPVVSPHHARASRSWPRRHSATSSSFEMKQRSSSCWYPPRRQCCPGGARRHGEQLRRLRKTANSVEGPRRTGCGIAARRRARRGSVSRGRGRFPCSARRAAHAVRCRGFRGASGDGRQRRRRRDLQSAGWLGADGRLGGVLENGIDFATVPFLTSWDSLLRARPSCHHPAPLRAGNPSLVGSK